MPNLPEIREQLKERLAATFPAVRLVDLNCEGLDPFLILDNGHAVYGFALVGEDFIRAFESVYSGFKKSILTVQTYRSREIGFILCVAGDLTGSEKFVSAVETDIYFCRKFVIGLSRGLVSALSTLPFMPLAPIDGTVRPPSAQTYLRKAGLPALLCKNIVVPNARSPEGILADCLLGRYGDFQAFKPAPVSMEEKTETAGNDVVLEKVTIKNIRAYRREQSFELGQNITILFGRNGFGKTSFFDAIDFAMTGALGRLPHLSGGGLQKAIQHLDSGAEDAFVSVSYLSAMTRNTLTRRVADPMMAELNNKVLERKDVLSTLTNSGTKERVDNLISLFRASHIFSLEQQELTREFKEDCRLSAEMVAKMLAVDDYANAASKVEKVIGVLKERKEEATIEESRLAEELTDDGAQLARLTQVTQQDISSAEIAEQTRKIDGVLRTVGLREGPLGSDLSSLRKSRAIVESEIGADQASFERLTRLAEAFAANPDIDSKVATATRELEQSRSKLNSWDSLIAEQNGQLSELREAVARSEQVVASSRSKLENLSWMTGVLPSFQAAAAVEEAAAQRGKDAVEQLEAAKNLERGKGSELNRAVSDQSVISDAVRVKIERQGQLTQVAADLPIYLQAVGRLAEVNRAEQDLQAKEAVERDEQNALKEQASTHLAQANALNDQAKALREAQSRINRLLSEIEEYIEGGVCPVCGEDHGTQEDLLDKIHAQRRSSRASSVEDELVRVREGLRNLETRIGQLETTRSINRTSLSSLASERDILSAQVRDSATEIGRLGLDPASPALESEVLALANRNGDELQELQLQLARATDDVGRSRSAHMDSQQAVRNWEASVAETRKEWRDAHGVITELRKDQRWDEITAALTNDQRLAAINLSQAELTTRTAELNQAKAELERVEAEREVVKRSRDAANGELGELSRSQVEWRRRQEEIWLGLSAVRLAKDTDAAGLELAQGNRRVRLGSLEAVRDQLINLELLVDTFATSASASILRQSILEKEKRKADQIKANSVYDQWLRFFEITLAGIHGMQANATADFVNQYGPRTSLIQRRLRSVYSFDDVEIQSEHASIVVSVRRGDQTLRPTDYFSQSQQQGLLLGLFLTASSSQTWSSFSPIFLDDPVTHFDDLNTYSLLDLISGLMETDIGQKQFVISTCDEKLLQLALRKFSHLGDRAKYYRFDAIGRDGPAISEVIQ